jgi:hypothetical protein
MADRVASPARRKPPTSNPKSRHALGGVTWDCRRRVVKKLGFPAARIARRNPPGRCVRQIVVEMLHSREFGSSGPFCADANLAPSEVPPPCVVAPLPHARLPVNSSLDETEGKFSSLQSIEKSQNVEIIAQSGGIHRRRPITIESIGSACPHPSLRGALATKQPRGRRCAAPGLLRFARNDGLEFGSLIFGRRLLFVSDARKHPRSPPRAKRRRHASPRRFLMRGCPANSSPKNRWKILLPAKH